MSNIVSKYEGEKAVFPYDFGTAYHNIFYTSAPNPSQATTSTGNRVVKVEYIITGYRLESADQHPSLFSTNEDKNISSFQGVCLGKWGFFTSTKETSDYISGLIPELTPAQLTSLFVRPGVSYLQSTVGTTDPSEIAPFLQLLQSKSIDPDTLDDSL